ncbi:MAG: carboxypeptidase regulatory-like domain-containing protein, partial [Myxococcota bacterium]
MSRISIVALLLLSAVACDRPQPAAGVITEDNAETLLLQGPAADGGVGDYYLRNEHVIAIIQRPGREFGIAPYGGNLMDFGPADLRSDALGETIPFVRVGLTADFETVRIVNDGSAGGPAVIEAEGNLELWDFLNLESFLRDLLTFDPIKDQPLRVLARYSLGPNDRHIEVRYTMVNQSDEELENWYGFAADMRGSVEPFSPGRGYTEPGVDFNDFAAVLGGTVDSPYIAYQGDGYALGLRSVDFLDGEPVPRLFIAIVGIAIVILDAGSIGDLLDIRRMTDTPAGEEVSFGFDLYVGRDVSDVHAWALAKESWPTLAGRVTEAVTGEPLGGVRVAAIDPATGRAEVAFVTRDDGTFDGRLAPGEYVVVADDLRRPADVGRTVTLQANTPAHISIELDQTATVRVEVQSANDANDPALAFTPCRVTLVGQAPDRSGGVCGVTAICEEEIEPFRHNKKWELGTPTPYIEHLIHCNTGSLPDAPLEVVPGKYLAIVSRGPEYDVVKKLIELQQGETALVAGELHRVVDSSGYVAADFHVHQVHSTDSVVPYEARVRSFVTAGLDFIATTDHDAVTDLSPWVELFGLGNELVTVPGVEVSTLDLGHYNGFPIEPLEGVQNG